MRKAIKVIVLLMIVIGSGLFCLLYISFNLSDSHNFVNSTFRSLALRQRFVITVLRLHQVGDARYEYMRDYSVPLDIHVFLQNGETLESGSLEKVITQLQQITYKTQKITVHDPINILESQEQMSDDDINKMLDIYEYRSSFLSPNVPLNIFVLSEYEKHPSYVGLVVDANSIILFKKLIRNVSDHEPSPEPAEVSTLLHEFAHLTGADHIPNESCILAEKVENIDLFNRPTVFRESYCADDVMAIREAL